MSDRYGDAVRVNNASTTNTAYNDDGVKITTKMVMDRVRWSSVLAGLFTVLATLITLTVLGLALGLSTVDANNPNGFALGASIYGGLSALIAFALGGFIAARTSAVAGSGNGLLNGAMVWLVTIPLIVNLLGSGIGTLLGTATDLAGDAAAAAAAVADDAAPAIANQANQAADGQAAAGAPDAGAQGAAAPTAEGAAPSDPAAVAQDLQEQVQNIPPEQIEETARDLSSAAWTTLLALGLTAAAAIVGGLLGARSYPTDVAVYQRSNAAS